jgi:hypothetical protein
MWKILGVDAFYVEFADVWKKRITEVVSEGDNGMRFEALMKDADVMHLMNGETEIHSFVVELSEKVTEEDIQFLADEVLNVAKTADFPFISLNNLYEKCQVIFTNEKEPEILGLDKAEGISAGAVFAPILEGWGGGGRKNETLM